MKKLIILISVITLGEVSAMAQPGTFDFNNSSTFPIKIASTIDAPATLIGTNATSEVLGAGPGQVTIELFVALNGTVPKFSSGVIFPPDNFFLAGTTTNSGSSFPPFQGSFHGGNPYTIPTSLDGGAFTAGTTIEYDFFAYNADFSYTGLSALGTDYTLGGGVGAPEPTFGTGTGQISGWTIVLTPEPSVIALGSFGAAAMLLFRRRK